MSSNARIHSSIFNSEFEARKHGAEYIRENGNGRKLSFRVWYSYPIQAYVCGVYLKH